MQSAIRVFAVAAAAISVDAEGVIADITYHDMAVTRTVGMQSGSWEHADV